MAGWSETIPWTLSVKISAVYHKNIQFPKVSDEKCLLFLHLCSTIYQSLALLCLLLCLGWEQLFSLHVNKNTYFYIFTLKTFYQFIKWKDICKKNLCLFHLYIFFGKVSVQIFAYFLNWVPCFLCWVLWVLWIPFSDMCFGNISFQFVPCLMIFLTVSSVSRSF